MCMDGETRKMATIGQAKDRWMASTPITMFNPPISQQEYDAIANDRAADLLEQMNAEEAAANLALAKQQFSNGLQNLRDDLSLVQTAINTSTPLTAAQIRVGFRDILNSLIWIGDHIADGTILTRK